MYSFLPTSSSVEYLSTRIDESVALEGLDFNQGSTISSTSTLPYIKQSINSRRLRSNGEVMQECNCSGGARNNKKILFAVLLATTFTSVNSTPSPLTYTRRSSGKQKSIDSTPPRQSIKEVPASSQFPIYHKRENVNSSAVSLNSTINNATTYNITTYNSISLETNVTSIVLPDGWLPTHRPTSYYPVPVIIALSIIVSLFLAGTIIGAVLLRRDRRKRRLKKLQEDGGTAEKGLKNGGTRHEKGVKGLLKRLKGKGRNSKSNPKKQGVNNRSDGNAGASSSAVQHRDQNNTRRRINATNMSNSHHNGSTTSLGLFATISRQQSNISRPSSPAPSLYPIQSRTSVSLGRPRSIATSVHNDEVPVRPRSLVSLSPDRISYPSSTALPTPGPPAYRPNSSRVQRVVRGAESTSAIPPSTQVEEWHWPNEKPNTGITSSNPTSQTHSPPPSLSLDLDLPPPIDRSTFSAHVATDDKATLARLRELAQTTLDRQSSSINLASAPLFDDENVDEDGFERFNHEEEIIDSTPEDKQEEVKEDQEEVPVTLGSLPLPPRPMTTSYIPTSAPSYGEEFRRRIVVQEATAPPADDEDDGWVGGEEEDDSNTAVI